MLIVSQNLLGYPVSLPKDVVLRVNLAWINNLEMLQDILKSHPSRRIFLDLPVRRTKPPNNHYNFEDLKYFFDEFENIEFLAISNVDSVEDLEFFCSIVPENVNLVPKIESETGILLRHIRFQSQMHLSFFVVIVQAEYGILFLKTYHGTV